MSVRKISIVATILVLVASHQAMAAPVNLNAIGTPYSIASTVPGQPNMILTPVAHPPGGTTVFPGTATASFSYFPGPQRWVLNITDLSALVANTTYGFQYYVDVNGWFGPGQDWRFGVIRSGMAVDDPNIVTLTTSIQGIIPDPNDPLQDPANAFGPPAWTLNSGFNPAPLVTQGNSFTSVVCGQCTRFLVTTTLATGALTTAITSLSNTFDMQQIPEPATMGLFALGLVGLVIARRRRKMAAPK